METKQAITAIGVRELEEQTREVLRRVREGGEVIDIVEEGKVLARLVPAPPAVDTATRRAIVERRRKLAEEIGKAWPDGMSAAEAVAEQRRDL
jgi:antitoxin (DNA-binding transcriptional repressor) of toxin-antitoxin stability system